ncbi:MAG: Crp/Fnr family transcriptional regulator [Candidatus Limnocylindria bacterium]
MDAERVAAYLAETPLFAGLTAAELTTLAERMRMRHYARDEVIFHKDDPAAHLFVIAAGTVKISMPDEAGHEVVVALERGGDVFGHLALFDDAPRSATVTAINETVLLSLARDDFLGVLERNPRAMRRMLGLLAKMVRRVSGRVEDLVFLDVPSRVAKCLLDLSEVAKGERRELSLTQEDLASFVGATRVSVNRVLADLEHRGVITVGRRHVEITDAELLRKEIRY